MRLKSVVAVAALSAILPLGSVALAQPAGAPPPRALAADVPAETPFTPHRIAGNLYFVGTKGLGVYLITTPAGHILINGVYPSSVPQILGNIEKLGFKPRDVKLMIQSHAHPDHVSGNALLKRATGARVLVMDDDVDVVKSGGRSDFQYSKQELFPPGPVDQVLHDHQTVSLGGMTLTALKTPGHTKGCTTWTFTVRDGEVDRPVVILCSINFNPGYKLVDNADWPGIADGFGHTYKVVKGLKPDIWLAPHTFMFGMEQKFAKLSAAGAAGPNPYVDPDGYKTYVDARQQDFLREFAKQMQP